MEVTVEPVAEWVALGVEVGIEVIHHFALPLYIVEQVFIAHRPGVQTMMETEFAERGRGVGYDGVDGTDIIDGIKFVLVEEWTLVWPIDIGGKGSSAMAISCQGVVSRISFSVIIILFFV